MSTKKEKQAVNRKVSNLKSLSNSEQTIIAYGLALHSSRLLTINRLICVSKSFAIMITKAKEDINFWKSKYENILNIKSLDSLISTRLNGIEISAREWMEGYDALFKYDGKKKPDEHDKFNVSTKSRRPIDIINAEKNKDRLSLQYSPLYPQNIAIRLELHAQSLIGNKDAKRLLKTQTTKFFTEIMQHRPINLRVLKVLFNQKEEICPGDRENVSILHNMYHLRHDSDAYPLYEELAILLSKGLKYTEYLSNTFINIVMRHKVVSLVDTILAKNFDNKTLSISFGLRTAMDNRADLEVVEKFHAYLKSIKISNSEWTRIMANCFKYDKLEYIQKLVNEFKRFVDVDFIMKVLRDEGLCIYGLSLPGSNVLTSLIMQLNMSKKNLEKMLIAAVKNSEIHYENKSQTNYTINVIGTLLKHPSFDPSCSFCESGKIYKYINPDIMKIVLSTNIKPPNVETILSFLIRNIYHHTDEDSYFNNQMSGEHSNEEYSNEEEEYIYRGGCSPNNSFDAINVIITDKKLDLQPLFNVLPLIMVIITATSDEAHRINKIFNKTGDINFTPHCYNLKAMECLLKDDRFDSTYHNNIATKLAFIISNSAALLALVADPRIESKWKEQISNINKGEVIKDVIEIISKFMTDNNISRGDSELHIIIRNVLLKTMSCFGHFEAYFESDNKITRDEIVDTRKKFNNDIINKFKPSLSLEKSFSENVYKFNLVDESGSLDEKYCLSEVKLFPNNERKQEVKHIKKKRMMKSESFSSNEASLEDIKSIKKGESIKKRVRSSSSSFSSSDSCEEIKKVTKKISSKKSKK